jgi:hypothetical protein
MPSYSFYFQEAVGDLDHLLGPHQGMQEFVECRPHLFFLLLMSAIVRVTHEDGIDLCCLL